MHSADPIKHMNGNGVVQIYTKMRPGLSNPSFLSSNPCDALTQASAKGMLVNPIEKIMAEKIYMLDSLLSKNNNTLVWE